MSGAELVSISLLGTQILLNDDEGVFEVDGVYGVFVVIPPFVLVGVGVGVGVGGVVVVVVVVVVGGVVAVLVVLL